MTHLLKRGSRPDQQEELDLPRRLRVPATTANGKPRLPKVEAVCVLQPEVQDGRAPCQQPRDVDRGDTGAEAEDAFSIQG